MVDYDQFAHTFSKSRKDHPWPELDYIIHDIKKQWYLSVLDIGCGNGRLLEELEKEDSRLQITDRKPRYLGIDNSIGMVEEARRLHPEYQFELCEMIEILDSRFPIWEYDAIIFLASFHHLETREARIQVLSDVRSLLTSWGRIYMTNWNLRDQPKYEKSHRWDGDYDIKIGSYSRYYHGFSVEELGELFLETGYEIALNRVWEGGRKIVSILSGSVTRDLRK